ncbi:MAG: division/cell wall cluster transcriptional repressor MraZ [Deltaproteobacteria bacterium]|nr:division/cell wall cluster transcriptional repressor MraZ [Deltaproteobacteria bacterium]
MFKGRYNHAVDGKGRTSLPAKFRENVAAEGNDRVVLTFALDSDYPHLDVYPFVRWSEFEQKLAEKPTFDENVILLKRFYVANAVECPVDSHGRILIPPTHRDYGGISSDATWVGMNRIIELWKPESWDAAQAEALANLSQIRKGLSAFDL